MIIPAILEEQFDEVNKKIMLIDKHVSSIQIDVIDGTSVPGKTFTDIQRLNAIDSSSELELHLMVKDPAIYMEGYLERINKVCAQIESYESIGHFIWLSKERGYKTGLSINPDTSLDLLNEFINDINFVQFMGVIPGKQGSPLVLGVLDKIKEFKQRFPNIETQIDGGINKDNINSILKTGVNHLVIGSAIFSSGDPIDSLLNLQNTAYGNSNNITNI